MGQNEDAATPMVCADFSRREDACLWRVAHGAKLFPDLGKSQIDVSFDVFAEDPFGLELPSDPGDLRPQVPGIVSAAPFAC